MKSSKVVWTEIGSLISLVDKRNSANEDLPVIGVNRDKDFMPTVANLDGIDLRKYKVIEKGNFIFSGMQTGRDICIRIGLYEREEPSLISPAYTTFFISRSDLVLPEFFFMYFCREEMDRYGAFCSDGSVRSNLDWDRFVSLKLPLPSIDEQHTIVDAWKSLRNIKEQNESLSAPIMQLCSSYLQECKHKFPIVELSPYIEECNNRNKELEFGESDLMGVKSDGTFIMSIADKSELKFHNYKIVRRGEFSYSNRINIGSIAMNRVRDCIVSPSYAVFKVKDDCLGTLLPDYLDMWYRRSEFLRSTLFFAFGTIKDDFSIENMKRSRVPLPPIDVQRAIVSLYQCALEYKAIAAEADEQAKKICSPLLQQLIHQS